MAYVPGYTNDIFISYAHVDNQILPGQTNGWIEQFFKTLTGMLERRFGRKDLVKIWWDTKRLDGSVVFDKAIEEGVNKSAIMISLNSPGYAESDYCKQEIDLFYKKAQKDPTGLVIGDRKRLIHVLLNNIPFQKWPKELSGISGFPFHNAQNSEAYGDTLEITTPEFRTQMQNLRDAIWNILTDLAAAEKKGEPQQATGATEKKDAFTIYLGEVADTLRTPRKRIINELEKKGFNVITGVPPPDEASAHEKATNEALQNADLAIHLLDEYPGREIVGSPDIWYPQKQTQLALQSGKSQMIWVPEETDFETIEDEKYKSFLQNVEAGKESEKVYDFIRGSKSSIAQQIIDFAEQIKVKQQQKKADQGSVSVLLDTHYTDQLYAYDLSKILLENKIQPFVNPEEGDPRKNISLLSDRISQVKKLIFLYGSVSKEWVLERMSAALQLIITNNYPIEDFFIYMAPPYKQANDISINQRFLKVNVVDSSTNQLKDNAALQQFLNALKTSGA